VNLRPVRLNFFPIQTAGRLVCSKRRTGDASPLRAAFEYKPRQILLFAAADMAVYFFVAVVVMPRAGNHKRGRSGRVTDNSTRAPRQPLVHASGRGLDCPFNLASAAGHTVRSCPGSKYPRYSNWLSLQPTAASLMIFQQVNAHLPNFPRSLWRNSTMFCGYKTTASP
jgi:hypothetical protein